MTDTKPCGCNQYQSCGRDHAAEQAATGAEHAQMLLIPTGRDYRYVDRPISELREGDVIDDMGADFEVMSIDNDHKSTSLELLAEGDTEPIFESFSNDDVMRVRLTRPKQDAVHDITQAHREIQDVEVIRSIMFDELDSQCFEDEDGRRYYDICDGVPVDEVAYFELEHEEDPDGGLYNVVPIRADGSYATPTNHWGLPSGVSAYVPMLSSGAVPVGFRPAGTKVGDRDTRFLIDVEKTRSADFDAIHREKKKTLLTALYRELEYDGVASGLRIDD